MAALLDGIAERAAEVDEIAEDASGEHNARWQALMMDPDGRDPALWFSAWEELVEPLGLMEYEDWAVMDVVDYVQAGDVPGKQYLWAATVATAKAQADLVLWRALLPVLERQAREQNREAGALSKAQLQTVANVGPGKARFDDAAANRRSARD